jgi:hypothetical protein
MTSPAFVLRTGAGRQAATMAAMRSHIPNRTVGKVRQAGLCCLYIYNHNKKERT